VPANGLEISAGSYDLHGQRELWRCMRLWKAQTRFEQPHVPEHLLGSPARGDDGQHASFPAALACPGVYPKGSLLKRGPIQSWPNENLLRLHAGRHRGRCFGFGLHPRAESRVGREDAVETCQMFASGRNQRHQPFQQLPRAAHGASAPTTAPRVPTTKVARAICRGRPWTSKGAIEATADRSTAPRCPRHSAETSCRGCL
jgi:hypothetical protein